MRHCKGARKLLYGQRDVVRDNKKTATDISSGKDAQDTYTAINVQRKSAGSMDATRDAIINSK